MGPIEMDATFDSAEGEPAVLHPALDRADGDAESFCHLLLTEVFIRIMGAELDGDAAALGFFFVSSSGI